MSTFFIPNSFSSNIATYKVYKTRNNNLELHDSIFASDLNVKNQEFLSFYLADQIFYLPPYPNMTSISFQISISEESIVTVRKIDTIIKALTDTGGFMSIIFGAISVLIGHLQEKKFYLSIIKKLFLVRQQQNSNTKQSFSESLKVINRTKFMKDDKIN